MPYRAGYIKPERDVEVIVLPGVEVGSPRTTTGAGNPTVPDANFSPLVPFTGTTVGGVAAASLQDDDYDYTAPIGGIELSGW